MSAPKGLQIHMPFFWCTLWSCLLKKEGLGCREGCYVFQLFISRNLCELKQNLAMLLIIDRFYFYCTVYISLLVDITSHSAFASLSLFILTDEFHLSLASMLF
jgi:hypothetical protein